MALDPILDQILRADPSLGPAVQASNFERRLRALEAGSSALRGREAFIAAEVTLVGGAGAGPFDLGGPEHVLHVPIGTYLLALAVVDIKATTGAAAQVNLDTTGVDAASNPVALVYGGVGGYETRHLGPVNGATQFGWPWAYRAVAEDVRLKLTYGNASANPAFFANRRLWVAAFSPAA